MLVHKFRHGGLIDVGKHTPKHNMAQREFEAILHSLTRFGKNVRSYIAVTQSALIFVLSPVDRRAGESPPRSGKSHLVVSVLTRQTNR